MTTFTIHTIESAPEASKSILKAAKKKLGFIPNLMATMAPTTPLLSSDPSLMMPLPQWRGVRTLLSCSRLLMVLKRVAIARERLA